MQYQYQVFEEREKNRIIIFSILAAICLTCITVSFDFRLFNLIVLLGPAFIIVQKIRIKYLINSEEMIRSTKLNGIVDIYVHKQY